MTHDASERTAGQLAVFHRLVANTGVASVTNNFVWFAVTFWAYLETKSVLATAIIGGTYMLMLAGAIAGNLRTVALSTTVTLLVPEDRHDKANGLVGTVNGLAFALTSVFSGLAIGFAGMGWSLLITIAVTAVAALHLALLRVPEPKPQHPDGK